MRQIEILELFAEAQSWVHAGIARAEHRYALKLQRQREQWEETRRFNLKTNPVAKARRQETCRNYNKRLWQITRADPVKRAANNARRMAAYYRKKP